MATAADHQREDHWDSHLKIPYKDYLLMLRNLRRIEKQLAELDPDSPFYEVRRQVLERELKRMEESMELKNNLHLIKGERVEN